jgi:ATP-dependent helicase HrpB
VTKSSLPIDALLPAVTDSLRSGSRLVLRAPPGAGKTTRVPAALLDAGIAGGKQVVVLEPRRIAARAAAEYVAAERGGAVGREVGYRVRFESRGGRDTRLWFVTEGVFSRGLVRDPYLEETGIVVLDEFHERHLQGDLALGVVRELQDSVRPQLKLVVMSATLDTEKVAAFLGAPVLTSEGRAHPVEIEYQREASRARLAPRVTAAVTRIVRDDRGDGDTLVFLPGAAAIRQSAEALAPLAESAGIEVVPLHGDLPLEAQRRAISRGERRRIVLSTNVAETALTIEGVTTVVDSGLVREARFDPRHGLNRLEEVRITRASAEQRAGRAGRVRPGRCVRLWTLAEHAELREREVPEILRLDLSATVLELRAWGVRDLRAFPWLDPPGAGALEAAERLLSMLGALDPATGDLTLTGRRMLGLPVSPRLARLLVEGERTGCADAPLVAALASERDILLERRGLAARTDGAWASGRSDLLLRASLFKEAERVGFDGEPGRRMGLDRAALRAVDGARRRLATGLSPAKSAAQTDDEETTLRCILAGFPDRVVRRRQPGSARGVMVGGTGVVSDPASVVREAELFVAVDLDGGPRRELSEARVRMASAIGRRWLEELFPGTVRTVREVTFDTDTERVVERERVLYYDLVLGETVLPDVDPAIAGRILGEAARRDPAKALAIGADVQAILDRIGFLTRSMPELGLGAVEEGLLDRAIGALAVGKRSFADLRAADLARGLLSQLTQRERRALDDGAPEHFRLPSGRLAPIAYARDKPPSIAARIQELFGLLATPRVAGGRVPVVVEVLAPSNRPVQVTDDLESFWKRTYPEVRKQLRGRYPKHAWPESPLSAMGGRPREGR